MSALIKDLGIGERAKRKSEASLGIAAGQLPVNVLASGSSPGVAETWIGLRSKPIGFSLEHLDDADRVAADQAFGGGVIWDPSSIYVACELGEDFVELVRGLFPGSVISQDTLEDIDGANVTLPASGHARTIHDPKSGSLVGIQETSQLEIAHHRELAPRMSRLAKSLETLSWNSEDVDPSIAQLYDEAENLPWKVLLSSPALAQSSSRALFSDDRWIRDAARSAGTSVFGTLAVLDVLKTRSVISIERHRELRLRLLEIKSWGVTPSSKEIVTAGQMSDWALDSTVEGAFRDRAGWRASPGTYTRSMVDAVASIYEQDPALLGVWVPRIISGIQESIPELPPSLAATLLLTLAWDINPEEYRLTDSCFRVMVAEIEKLSPWMIDPRDDPVVAAIRQILTFFADQQLDVQAMRRVYGLIIRRLTPFHGARVSFGAE